MEVNPLGGRRRVDGQTEKAAESVEEEDFLKYPCAEKQSEIIGRNMKHNNALQNSVCVVVVFCCVVSCVAMCCGVSIFLK